MPEWVAECSQGWDKTYCLRFVEEEFDDIHFFGDKTFEVLFQLLHPSQKSQMHQNSPLLAYMSSCHV